MMFLVKHSKRMRKSLMYTKTEFANLSFENAYKSMEMTFLLSYFY